MDAQVEHQEAAQSCAYNPFPEPQTIPSGWDTSVLVTSPQPALPQADAWTKPEAD